MKSNSYIYIITNKTNTAIYISVTTNLIKRIFEHRNKLVDGFSARYGLYKLVYYEIFDDLENALNREKQLKRCIEIGKITLLEDLTPDRDVYDEIRS